MAIDANVWDQLKGLSDKDIIKALEKDGWTLDGTNKNTRAYIKGFQKPGESRDPKTGIKRPYIVENRRIVIHPHPGKSYGPKLLKGLLADIGWTEEDYRRLKLIK